jgi:pyridoxamine 5'-phosphate oxidase
MFQRGVERFGIHGVERAADNRNLRTNAEPMRLINKVCLDDLGLGMFPGTGSSEGRNTFYAGVRGEFYFLALQKIKQIAPAAAYVQHTFAREVGHAADGFEAGSLRRRAGPEERPKLRAVLLGRAVVRLEIFWPLAGHACDDRLAAGMNKPLMIPWLGIFRAALQREYGDRPRIVTLASVDAKRRPRARSVILRRIDDDGALWITSNAFAAKNEQLRESPVAELVAYLPGSREQFRLAGRAQVIGPAEDQGLREEFWKSMSDAARATFFWPRIGEPVREGEAVPASTDTSVAMPAVFELIAVKPEEVEHLTTAAIPHRRTRWREEREWTEERINP